MIGSGYSYFAVGGGFCSLETGIPGGPDQFPIRRGRFHRPVLHFVYFGDLLLQMRSFDHLLLPVKI